MSDSEIEILSRKIYRKHQRALDLIYEYRPDEQGTIREILEKLVKAEKELILDDSSKSRIRFAVKDWETPLLLQGEGWTHSGRMLLFEFVNSPNKLALHLIIGPGPNDTRQKLFDSANNQQPFKPPFRSLNKKWNTIYVRPFLTALAYEEVNLEAIESEINKKWQQFLENDFIQIKTVVNSQEWIRENK